jgi:hypothetical protein
MKIVLYQKGGLGNQLYQFALAKYLSYKYNSEIISDITYYKYDKYIGNTHREFCLNYIISNLVVRISFLHLFINFIFFKLLNKNSFFYFITDNNFELTNNINYINNNKFKFLILNGYFQNNKEILNIIESLNFTKLINLSIRNHNINYETSIAIHIRKGDYLKFENIYYNLSSNYYMKAIEYLNKKYNIIHSIYIFTDDFIWVKYNILINKKFIYNILTSNSTIEDFKLLSSFNKVILSNSTFSLWSTYISLNNKLDVITPKNWYVDKFKNIDFIKYNIPKNFIKL